MTELDGHLHAPASEVWLAAPARHQLQRVGLPGEPGRKQDTLLLPTATYPAERNA